MFVITQMLFYFLYQLITVKDILCIRGCWDTPEKASKAAIIDQFKDQIQQEGFRGLTETLYFPRYTGKLFFLFLFYFSCQL